MPIGDKVWSACHGLTCASFQEGNWTAFVQGCRVQHKGAVQSCGDGFSDSTFLKTIV